ncbi:MAG: hypothetical protein WC959_09325 [Kiritimatiellales bacterium]
MKKILAITGIILVVLIAAVLLLLGTIIKTGVTTVGPKIIGVPIELHSVSINPFTGTVNLKGLVVGNPAGFNTPSAMELGEFKINLCTKSLFSDTIVIKEILIREPGVTYERALRGSNLSAIQDHLASPETVPAEETAAAETPAEKAAPAKKVIIEDFQLNGAKVNVSITAAGGRRITLPLPPVHLKDIGKEKGGATPVEAAKEIFSSVTHAITQLVASAGDLTKNIGSAASDAAKSATEVTKDAAKGAVDATKDAADSIKKGVGNIFGK